MSIYFKIWFVLATLMVLASWLTGFLSVVRGGCHIYPRWNISQARTMCAEGAALLLGATMVLLGLLAGPQAVLSTIESLMPLHLSQFATGVAIFAIVCLSSVLAYYVAAAVFRQGKLFNLRILRKQTCQQRAVCRKEGALACTQPQPCKCPIGIKRPLLIINEEDIFNMASAAKSALAKMVETWGDNEQTPCLYTTVASYAPFGGKRVRVPEQVVDELQRFADVTTTVKEPSRFAVAIGLQEEASA